MTALFRPLCLIFLVVGGLPLVACGQQGTTPSKTTPPPAANSTAQPPGETGLEKAQQRLVTVAAARAKTDQREFIDAAIRAALNLPADALLGASERARVTTLDFLKTTLTDVGAAILADPSTGLKALTTLNLNDTKVGDAGAAALAAPESGLKALTTLSLWHTKVGDAGAAALAAPDTGLNALTTLDLSYTEVGDAGAAAIKQRFPGITIHR